MCADRSSLLCLVACLLAAAVSGCASYEPKPLGTRPDMLDSPAHITVDPSQMPLAELAAHRFDPSDGLDSDEVAMLAVANNPQLKLARDDAGIARAQAFAAGLLPDPQVSLTRDFPTNGTAGNTSAFNAGLGYDVNALLLRSAKVGAAQAQQRKVDLNLLWQEWQVVSQARLLFVRSLQQERLLRVLNQSRAVFATRYRHAQEALKNGNMTLDAVTASLTALQDVERQINDRARRVSRNRLALNQLLGLAPDVKLDLVGETALPALDAHEVTALLPKLAERRPDLMALQAGYQSQEFRFRQAIMAQFPALNIGLTRARDTSSLYTLGFGITLSLPIFNRNQGNIAIERATRRRLYDEYQQRLNTTYSEVYGILEQQGLLEKQLAGVNGTLITLDELARNGETALKAGNLGEPAYSNLRAGLLSKRLEAITLEQQILEQRIAIQTLLGSKLPLKTINRGAEK